MYSRLLWIAAIGIVVASHSAATATQVVFLDFDSRTEGNEIQYTSAQRSAIQSRMEADYELFDFSFTQTRPTSGDYSTLFFNSGEPLGRAQHIDFRNLDRNDTAEIQITGSASSSFQIINLSANVGSHELGHLLGLTHGDSFGPLGSGRDPNTADAGGFGGYTPSYTGPAAADETRFHIMESDSLGNPEVTTDQFFSERSAVKLTFNEFGTVLDEAPGNNNSIANAQNVELFNMAVPNTLTSGDNAGVDLYVDAVVVTGSRSSFGDDDYYRFDGMAGELFNMEIISQTIRHRISTIDPTLTLYGPSGSQIASNDDSWEGFDSILLDFTLPSDGVYTVEVSAFRSSETGSYELFMYRLTDAPEPEGLAGDFNGDMIVDAADYAVVARQPGGDGRVGIRARFGQRRRRRLDRLRPLAGQLWQRRDGGRHGGPLCPNRRRAFSV